MTRLVPPRSGWTKTPNRLLDETARVGAALPARHRSVLDFLVREAFGWGVSAVIVSQRTIAGKLGVSDRTVREAVGDLERWRVVGRRGAGPGRIATFEILDPRGWRISRTSGSIRRAEARRLSRGGDQPLLPFADVASVLNLPTRIGVTSRDRWGDIPRGLSAALYKKKENKESIATKARGGDRIRRTLSRPGDRMPNDDPLERASAEEIATIGRLRAARLRVRRLSLGDPLDPAKVAEVERGLSDEDADAEIARRELEVEAAKITDRGRREAEAMRHEGRR